MTIIKEMKTNKSPGIGNKSVKTVKNILINKIFQTGICPLEFKMSLVKPIHKSGDKCVMSNYRPISFITCYTKIFEKIFKLRIMRLIEKHNIISDKRFGFRSVLSIEDAMKTLISKIYKSLDQS